MSDDLQQRAAKIRLAVFDIDGVMTDGMLYLGPNGEETKAVSVRDGLGIKQLLNAGIAVAVISGRPSPAMHKRLSALGVQHLFLGDEHKLPIFERLQQQLGLSDEQCAMMGDDTPDLPLMRRCGLALSVADGHRDALAAAHFVSQFRGGAGAVREASDLILAAQGLLP